MNAAEETTVSVINSASSEFSAPRVVVNPAVLRYLEQNRPLTTSDSIERREAEDDLFSELMAMNSHDDSHQTSDELSSSTTGQEPIMTTDTTTASKTWPISASEWTESERFFHDDLFRDFSTCSTDFLPSARLAEWILTHAQ